jgi:hypothetical protein
MSEDNQQSDRDSDENVASQDRTSATARQSGGSGQSARSDLGDHPVKLHSPLLPLLWLLFPFLAMITYGLLVRH